MKVYYPKVVVRSEFPDEGGWRPAINKLHGKIGLPKRKGEDGVLHTCGGKSRFPDGGGVQACNQQIAWKNRADQERGGEGSIIELGWNRIIIKTKGRGGIQSTNCMEKSGSTGSGRARVDCRHMVENTSLQTDGRITFDTNHLHRAPSTRTGHC